MRTVTIIGAASLSLTAFTCVAKAEFTGTVLYQACTSKNAEFRGICEMWIDGFLAGVGITQSLAPVKKMAPITCIPDGVTGVQAALIIEKWMRDHPEKLNVDAGAIAMTALDQAYPCSPKGRL